MRRVYLVKIRKPSGRVWNVLRMCEGCECVKDYLSCSTNGKVVECKRLGGSRLEDGEMSEKDGQNIGKAR